MAHALYVCGRFAIYVATVPARPGQGALHHARWVSPHVWGSSEVEAAADPAAAEEALPVGEFAERMARRARSVEAQGGITYAPPHRSLGWTARPAALGREARLRGARRLVRASIGAEPGRAPLVRVPRFDLLAAAPGDAAASAPRGALDPARWGRVGRGLIEGLAEALGEERVALGRHYAPLRAELDAAFAEAGTQAPDTVERLVDRATRSLALSRTLEGDDTLGDVAALWYAALVQGFMPLRDRVENGGPLWDDFWLGHMDGGNALAQALAARVALARAARTEDPEEAFAWVHDRLRDGVAAYQPTAAARPPTGPW